ncbi:MAG TPA: hypothetical protein VLZ83_09360 [Edaphocola sp.]|nr:hypothetical protein [Edaphocola sp.]
MNLILLSVALLVGIVLFLIIYKKDKTKDAPVKWLPALLRGLLGFLTALLLLAPVFSGLSKEEELPTIIWLQDVSTSTPNALSGYQKKYQEEQKSIIEKLKKNHKVMSYGFGSSLVKDSIYNYNQKATNIATALEQIENQFQDKNLGAIILASDGIYNEGANPYFNQFSKPIPIYSIALGDSTTPKDLKVNSTYSNKTVALNNSFEIFADITATGLTGKQSVASLAYNGKTIVTQNIIINNNDFATSISFTVKAEQVGLQKYSISLSPIPEEKNTQNNSQSVVVEVKEKKSKILLFANTPHPDIGFIKNALKNAAQFDLDVIINGVNPNDIDKYDILIAYQNTPKVSVNIPTWYILGTQTTNNALLYLKERNIEISATASNDLMPQLNSGFNLFTLPQNILAVIPKLPPLSSNFQNTKNTGNKLLQDNRGNGLWVFNNSINSPYAILNGEGLWRWGMYEYKNFNNRNATEELVIQTLNALSIEKDNKSFRLFLLKNNISDNEAPIILGELRNTNGELINEPEAKLTMHANGKTLNYNFEKTGNSYRLQPGLLAPGDYKLTGTTEYKGKTYQDHALLHINDIPLEALRTYSDFDLMYQLAKKSNGSFFTQFNFSNIADSIVANPNIKTFIHTQTQSKPIIDKRWIFFLIIALASSEWLLRKLWSMN